MALRNPTTGPRIVPFGEARRSSDVLTNGHPGFRVTQRFADTDRFFGGRHGAIDLGNFNCGDAMLASVSGYVQNRRDIYGANICEIVESSGNVVGYGHLSSFARAHSSYVTRGTTIGYVGDTGLGGVCHCHFYRRLGSGSLVDPWPLLEQNSVTPPTPQYVKFNSGVDGVNLRTAPDARKANIFAVAWKDPTGIRRGTKRNGRYLGATSARRLLQGSAPVAGPDGQLYWRLKLTGTTAYSYVQSRFMRRV